MKNAFHNLNRKKPKSQISPPPQPPQTKVIFQDNAEIKNYQAELVHMLVERKNHLLEVRRRVSQDKIMPVIPEAEIAPMPDPPSPPILVLPPRDPEIAKKKPSRRPATAPPKFAKPE